MTSADASSSSQIETDQFNVIEEITGRPFDIEFWKFQNKMRMEPGKFIPFLKDMLKRFDGKKYKGVGGNIFLTQEGPDAVQELIDFLLVKQSEVMTDPLMPLLWSKPLTAAATKMAKMQGVTG